MRNLDAKQAAMRRRMKRHRHEVRHSEIRPFSRRELRRLQARQLIEEGAAVEDVARALDANAAAVAEWQRRGMPIRGPLLRINEDFP